MNKCVFSGGLCCMFDGPCCNTQPIFYYFVWAIKILQILIPVILLIIGIIKLINVKKTKNEIKIYKAKIGFKKMIIIAAISFIIPLVVSIIISLTAKESKPDWRTCWRTTYFDKLDK